MRPPQWVSCKARTRCMNSSSSLNKPAFSPPGLCRRCFLRAEHCLLPVLSLQNSYPPGVSQHLLPAPQNAHRIILWLPLLSPGRALGGQEGENSRAVLPIWGRLPLQHFPGGLRGWAGVAWTHSGSPIHS